MRAALCTLFEEEGYRVATAGDGRKALSLLRDGQAPCAIVLDLMLPVMDGWEFRKHQLADPTLATVPVIVLSAVAGIPEQAAKLKAVAYCPKPPDVDTLLSTISRYCCEGSSVPL